MVGKLLFTANDGVHGEEMWVTDGTPAGTYALGDIAPGPNFQRDEVTVFSNGEALFPGSGASGGVELWATDGSAAGTAVFTGIPSAANMNPPGAYITASARLGNGDALFEDTPLAEVGSEVTLWATNHTDGATTQIAQFGQNPKISVGPSLVTLDNGDVMFNAFDTADGTELWITDGTAAGTMLLSDLTPGTGSTILSSEAVVSLGNGQNMFIAGPFELPGLLVATDGTTAGTTVLYDFGRSSVSDLISLGNGKALFAGNNGSGAEPWVTNGTAAGTYQLLDINPGPPGSLAYASPELTALGNGTALFQAVDGTQGSTGEELWVTDGTSDGTTRLQTFGDDTASVGDFTSIGGGEFVFDSYDDVAHTQTVWRTDGTSAGTSYIVKFDTPANTNSTAANFSLMKDAADPGKALIGAGEDLWVTDGTSDGTSLVAQGADGHITFASSLNGETLLRVSNDTGTAAEPVASELWITDGTPAGTKQLGSFAGQELTELPLNFVYLPPAPPDTWVGGTSNDFATGANWSSGLVPFNNGEADIIGAVDVSVTTDQTIATLGLGSAPVLDISGGTLFVSGDIIDQSPAVIPAGGEDFSGGGTIVLDTGGMLEAGGSVAAGITVGFNDANADVLQLDGINAASPNAFAGTIVGFAQGDGISLPGLQFSTPVTASYGAGVLSLINGGSVVATLNLAGSYLTGNFMVAQSVLGTEIGEVTNAPPAVFAWNPFATGDWNTPANWLQLPITPAGIVSGVNPRPVDSAFIIVSGVTVSDIESVATLGLATLNGGTPPVLDINGGDLDVSGAILDTFTTIFPAPIGSATFAQGGTIDLGNAGTLEAGHSVSPAITVDFADGNNDVLQLDGVTSGAPNAFAGTIANFTHGDTIVLDTVRADPSDALSFNAGTLTLTEDGLTIATFNVAGSYANYNFAVQAAVDGLGNNVTDITEAPAFAWIPENFGGTPSFHTNWNDPATWVALPATVPPVTGTVPGAGEDAFIVGGTGAAIVNVVEYTQSLANLGLGVGNTPDVILPIIQVEEGSLVVAANILDTFSGVFPGSTASQNFSGGGTIELEFGGVLEAGGSVAAGITVDMTDHNNDRLILDAVNSGDTNAFAGMVVGFTQGDTITLPNAQATTAHYNAGTLTLLSGTQVEAVLNVAGTTNANLITSNFIVANPQSGVTTITETTTPPPPGTINWTGAPGAAFDTAENWDLDQTPNATNNVVIPAGGVSDVLADQFGNASTNVIDSLQVALGGTLSIQSGDFTINDKNLASLNAGQVVVASGVQLDLDGTFNNSGLVQLAGTGAELLTSGSTVSIGGTGTIAMTQGTIGGRSSSQPADTLAILGDTIEGSGVIGDAANPLTLINNGLIEANGGAAAPLTLTGSVANGGTLDADTNSLLILSGTIVDIMPPAGGPGTIEALHGGTVRLDNLTVTDGVISADATSTIEIAGNVTLDGIKDLTLSGNVVLDKGATLTLMGTVYAGNNGETIDTTNGQLIVAAGANTTVQWSGPNVLFGGGTIYAIPFMYEQDQLYYTFTGGLPIGAGETVTLAQSADGSHQSGFFIPSGQTISIDGAGATLLIDTTIVIGGLNGDGNIVLSNGGMLAGTNFDNSTVRPAPGSFPMPEYDWLVIDSLNVSGAGIITGMEIWNTYNGTIMANGGTLFLNSGTDYIEQDTIYNNEETVSDGVLGATATGDLVIMGTVDLRPNIIDGSSPGGALTGPGQITFGGSTAITGARSGTLVGGTIAPGMTIQVDAPGGGIDGVTVSANAGFVVNAGALFTLSNYYGSLVNSGTIALNGSSVAGVHDGASLAPIGDVTLTGGGLIELENGGDPNSATEDAIVSVTNSDTLENTDNTIAGYGFLGGSYLNLNNFATIDANVLGKNLSIDGGSLNSIAGVIDNDGLMEASNGGTLVIKSAILNYANVFSPFEPIFAPGTSNIIGYGTVVPSGGGDISAIGPNSAIALDTGTITSGILSTAGGGIIYVTGDATLAGGDDAALSLTQPAKFGGPDIVVNTTTAGQQSNGAVAGLIGNQGRIAVAWVDSSGTTPVVRYQVLDQFDVAQFSGDMAVSAPLAANASQTDPSVAALSHHGFVITWLETSGGTTSLRAETFHADLSPANSAISVTLPAGATAQHVATMSDGGFAVVWADAAAPGVASPMHLQRFSATGVPGPVVDLGLGLAPDIALAAEGSGSYAVTWASPVNAGADGSVFLQTFTAAGVAGTPSVVPASIGGSTPSSVAPGTAPFIVSGQQGYLVFWTDPTNGPQGASYVFNGTQEPGDLSGYIGLYTASTAQLPDGRFATAQTIPDGGASSGTNIGLQVGAPAPVYYGLVSYADIVVKTGETLTVDLGLYNNGLIALSAAGNAVLAASGNVTVEGPGTITLGGASDAITGATGADTFINDGNTILGTGIIGGLNPGLDNLSLDNEGTIDATGGGTMAIATGTGTLANIGVMEATTAALDVSTTVINGGMIEAVGGTVTLHGGVASTGIVTGVHVNYFQGALEILGGEMILDGSVDAAENIFFSTATNVASTLVINDPSQMKGMFLDFSLGDTIDVFGVQATSAVFSDQAQTLSLLSAGGGTVAAFGIYTVGAVGQLAVTPDGKGGTLVEMVQAAALSTGSNPAAAALPNGFVEVSTTSTGEGVYEQIFNNAKQPLTSPLLLDANGEEPSVAAQTDGSFLVTWADTETNTIQGKLFDATQTPLPGTLNLTTAAPGDSVTQTNPFVTAIQGSTPTGYGIAYNTTDFSTNPAAQSVTYLDLDLNGAPRLAPVVFSQTSVTIGANVYPVSVQGSPAVIALASSTGDGQEVLATLAIANPVAGSGDLIALVIAALNPALFSGAGVSGADLSDTLGLSLTTDSVGPQAVLITPANDGKTHVSPQIAELSNGNAVVAWDQIAPGDADWTVAGQIVTSAGQFVGPQFTIATALPAASTPDRPAISALPGGDFVVTYDDGASSLAGQKFDASGNPLGGPFSVSNTSQGDPVTIVTSNGTLLSLSGDSDGTVSIGTFSVQAAGATWTGATGTDLGTAGNWQPVAVPNATETLTFNTQAGGILTGSANGMNAMFSGTGVWLMQGATLTLAGETVSPNSVLALTENGNLAVTGGSIAAAGSVDIETGAGQSMSVLGGAQVNAQGLSMGLTNGQTGVLTVSGAGTSIQNTGSSGSAEVGGSGSGQVAISAGASFSAVALGAVAAMTLGEGAGGTGAFTVTGAGSQATLTGQLTVGEAGGGTLLVSNQGTVLTGNDAAVDPSEGFDEAQLAGGSGEATVTGAKSLLSNTGRFVVGDAGLGGLSILAGATVTTAPGVGSSQPGAVIANAAGAAGSSVDVSGAGSNWQVTGLLDVGVAGSGALQIDGAATVTAGSLDAGNVATAVGQISVTGAGTSLEIGGAATVADDGTGVLSVLNGATFSASDLTIGSQGDSSGALVVSGSGSVVNLTGDLNIGTALGIGDLTVGPGAAVHASVVNLQGQVVLEGGLLDPTVQLINQGQTVGGFGTIAAGDIVDEGVIQAGGNKASQKLLLVQGNLLGGGTLTVDGSQPGSNAAGILQINAGGTMELTGAVLNAATTTFTDNLTPTGTYTVNNSVMDVTFADAAGVLKLDDIAGFAGTITTFHSGDSFVITGGTLSNPAVINGNTLTFADSGVNAGAGGVDSIIFAAPVSAAGFNVVNNTVQVACFAEGTLIETETGPVAVEALRTGDRAMAADTGHAEPIVWIGQRTIHCTRHPRPETVWPVRVRAGAFGENVPVRDLYLSPDHAILVNDVLVPVKLLINGTSIGQEKWDRVTYFHVELPRHAVILAESLPVESYLDTGDRANFNQDGETGRLFPDFAARLSPDAAMAWEMRGAAPLVMTGPRLEAARAAVIVGTPVAGFAISRLRSARG